MPERATASGRSGKSAEAIVPEAGEGPNEREEATTLRLEEAMPQMSEQLELALWGPGGTREDGVGVEAESAARGNALAGREMSLMERVVTYPNLQAALKRVKKNKGSPGVDGMSVQDLDAWLSEHWERTRGELLSGTYQPSAVLRREIPKAGGGMRPLGIPTAVDRLIQQMIQQVLTPIYDPTFSPWSFGFRPGRSAHDAIVSAQRMVQSGRRVVADVDLKSFFDRVQHDVLMERLSRRIGDKVLLGLIRRFLSAGILAGGITLERYEGTPQGGPLSPLLANILLDEVDKELERHGHSFVRYADDCNVYVRSRRAGERVMALLRRLYGRLRLAINEEKSAVDSANKRKFLGYSFWYATGSTVKRRVASKTLQVFKAEIREQTRRVRGESLASVIGSLEAKLVGWKNYFRLADTPNVFRELDGWIRHRLRALQLKQWRRGPKAYRELRRLGASVEVSARIAANLSRWWHNSGLLMNSVLDIRFFDRLGLPRLAD